MKGMKKIYIILTICLISSQAFPAQNTSWLWSRAIGSVNADESQAIASDSVGNIYVAGAFFNNPLILGNETLTNSGSYDIYLVKYNAAGSIQWAKRTGSNNAEISTSIFVNNNNEILLTGNFYSNSITFGPVTLTNSNTNGSGDIFLAKYDSNGNVLWAKKAGGSGEDRSNGVAADANGNIFITGSFNSQIFNFGPSTVSNIASDSSDVFIAKYDSNGNEVWALNAGGNNHVYASSLAVDGNSNIVVCGYFKSQDLSFGNSIITNLNSDSSDVFVVKLDNNANVLWAKNGGGNRNDMANSLVTDKENNVYVTGSFSSPTINFGSLTMSNAGIANMFLIKYDADGNEIWSVNSEGVHIQQGHSICTDRNGYVYIGGSFHANNVAFGNTMAVNNNQGNFSADNFVVKYDTDGNVQWLQTSGGDSDDEVYSICSDVNDNIISTGLFTSSSMIAGTDTLINAGNMDVFVSKLCNASARINTIGTATICDGEILTLNSDLGGTYTWSNGSTTQSININTPGSYWVHVTNPNGCSMTSVTKNITTSSKPIVTYDEINDSVIITASSFTLSPGNPPGGTYTGDGVAGNIFDPSIVSIGNYEITYSYTDPNGCSNLDKSTISVVRDPSNPIIPENNIFITYPVQIEDFTTLKFNSSIGTAKVYVFNSAGEKVIEVKYNGQPVILDFRKLPASAYFIFVRTLDRTQTKKVIKE